MRIYKKDGQLQPRFSLQWEEQRLRELGDSWVPFSLPGDTYVVGRLHAQSHEIVFFQNIELHGSQLVALEFPENTLEFYENIAGPVADQPSETAEREGTPQSLQL